MDDLYFSMRRGYVLLLKVFVIDEICYLMILNVKHFKTNNIIELCRYFMKLNLTMEGPPDSVNHHLDLCGDRRPLFDATNRIKLRPIANDRYSFEHKAFPLRFMKKIIFFSKLCLSFFFIDEGRKERREEVSKEGRK